MTLPFDGHHDEAIVECIRLASLEQLGNELARRCSAALAEAEQCKETARTSDDLVVIAEAATMAHAAAELCGHLSSAVCSLLGAGDVAVTKQAFAEARTASTHAALAATRWSLMKKARCAHA